MNSPELSHTVDPFFILLSMAAKFGNMGLMTGGLLAAAGGEMTAGLLSLTFGAIGFLSTLAVDRHANIQSANKPTDR